MKVVIYSKPQCPYCENAKKLANLLKERGHLNEIEIHDCMAEGISKEDLAKIMGREVRTFPQIKIVGEDETYIGGYTEFDAYAEEQGWI